MTVAASSSPPWRPRLWWVVDASVWVSRYIQTDVNHTASRAWLYQHLSRHHVVVAPTLLLVEVAGAVARRTGDAERTEQIVRTLRELSALRWVAVTVGVRDHSTQLAARLRLRGADAIYVALADRLRIPLVTWDREQLTRVTPPIVAFTP